MKNTDYIELNEKNISSIKLRQFITVQSMPKVGKPLIVPLLFSFMARLPKRKISKSQYWLFSTF